MLKDKNGTVLSLPPLINGVGERDLVGDERRVHRVHGDGFAQGEDCIEHGGDDVFRALRKPFQVEPVDVVDFMGNERSYPDFMTRFVDVDVDYVNKRIGTEIETKEMGGLLCKMQLASKVTRGEDLAVEIPPTRSDVLHACDIAEDVAIAYGYNNIKQTIPKASTIGKGQPINHFSDLVREEIR